MSKRQRGRKVQQASAGAATTAVAPAVIPTAISTTTNTVAPTINAASMTATVATTGITTTSPTAAVAGAATIMASTNTAANVDITATANIIDDGDANPFLDPPTEAHHEIDQALQLEGHLRALAIHSPPSLNDDHDSAVWTSSESELDAPLQNRKEARDVKDFFTLEKGWRYCKYCMYVFCLYVKCFPF
jgi:hypothetical protein